MAIKIKPKPYNSAAPWYLVTLEAEPYLLVCTYRSTGDAAQGLSLYVRCAAQIKRGSHLFYNDSKPRNCWNVLWLTNLIPVK